MIGELYKDNALVSAYTPPLDVLNLTKDVKKEYAAGVEILHRPWLELNDYSVIDRMNKDQRTFNAFVDETDEDPNEKWKWKGTRSMASNRARGMHAHLTASYIIPMIFAQNDAQKEDRDMAEVMRDILEWMSLNSNYRWAFLAATQGMLVNPVTYLGAEFFEVFQDIKEKTEKGYSTKKIIDETLSGFQASVYSANEILITNAFQQDIQRQRTIIERRYIEPHEAESKYGEHDNWGYVRTGMKSIYSDDDGLFYDVKDTEHPFLIEECIVKCRREDYEIPFLNGIYMGDGDVESNPMRHRGSRNEPKYNKIPFGYQRINEHFFFYKSLMNIVGWDNNLLDAMYQIGMNKAILDTLAPIVITGEDKIDTNIVFPNSIVAFENPETKVSTLMPQTNNYVLNAMPIIENSIQEASIADTQLGQLPQASQKAFTVARAEQNAKTILSGVFKSLGLSMIQFGQLMVDIVIQHLTVAQVDEISGSLAYKSFLLENQTINGKKVSKNLRFDESLIGKKMTGEEKKQFNLNLLSEVGFPETKEHLYIINPYAFSKMKYYVRIEPDMMREKNEAFEQAIALQGYTTFQNNPYIDQEQLTRKAINAIYGSSAEDLMAKNVPQVQPSVTAGTPEKIPQSELGSQFQSKQLGRVLAQT